MNFIIKHEIKGRLRIHVVRSRMTYAEADTLCWFLEKQEGITNVKVYERTADAAICYTGDREKLICILRRFRFETAEIPEQVLASSGRTLNTFYREQLIEKTLLHYAGKLILPSPVRKLWLGWKAVRYIGKGIGCLARGKIEVPVLDATAISVSVLRGDFNIAGSVMFLLGIGELLEEWTHKKSVGDLARSMSVQVSKAEHLADRLVPYTLLGTGAVWLMTRNVTKALSVLMVDFSCALKLAMPIAVLSAIRQAGQAGLTVKGGKYLEAVAEADTIVFDKTGTLTRAKPTVKAVVVFGDYPESEALRIAACLEEHFPHSMARAVVEAAKKRKLYHEEMHSKVEYIVAHGISSYIEEKRVIVGSRHFVFEDEKCRIRPEYQQRFEELPEEYSHLYLAVDGELAAVICIEDPLREEAKAVIQPLREAGISKIVMMTGDSEKTAASIAQRVGVDEYYSEVLPEDKADFIEREKAAGRKVVMIGDGINDSPALSASDAGIAVSGGVELAREIADIMIEAEDLHEIVMLKYLSDAMMRRIHKNYKEIIGINSGLIVLGVAGWIQPTASALLHNMSTLTISLNSMRSLLCDKGHSLPKKSEKSFQTY